MNSKDGKNVLWTCKQQKKNIQQLKKNPKHMQKTEQPPTKYWKQKSISALVTIFPFTVLNEAQELCQKAESSVIESWSLLVGWKKIKEDKVSWWQRLFSSGLPENVLTLSWSIVSLDFTDKGDVKYKPLKFWVLNLEKKISLTGLINTK